MKRKSLIAALVFGTLVAIQFNSLRAEERYSLPRCEVVPQPNNQVSLQIDGAEKTRWHFDAKYPRPFFYPFSGPSGTSLTRMGHPGAPNHDHHRSIWIGHHRVAGNDFWSDTNDTSIRQKMWNCYLDGDEAIMAATCSWVNNEQVEVAEQQIVAALIPMENQEHGLEIQLRIQPPPGNTSLVIDKTNFGFLAIRVAKSISAVFGGGTISNSEGLESEKNVFGKRAKWVDYSGPIASGRDQNRKLVTEGITCFDHPSNPRYPTHWHVRDDGWMGASFCMQQGIIVDIKKPLVLRYLLHAHSGSYSQSKAEDVHENFSRSHGFVLSKSSRAHHEFEIERLEN